MKVYELLNTPDKWIQGNFARNIFDQSVSPHHHSACCWCFEGAVRRCYGDFSPIFNILDSRFPNRGLLDWNDNEDRTYDDIIKLAKELEI